MRHHDLLTDPLGEHEVLFVSDLPGIESTLTEWLPEIPLVFARSVSDAYSEFDATIGVVCVSVNLLDDQMEEFRRDALFRHPSCQFIVIESDHYTNDRVENYDVILEGPVSKYQLQRAIRHRLKCATYSTLLHEYYLLNTRTFALTKFPKSDTEEVIAEITERLEDLQERLKRMEEVVSVDEIRAISENLDQRREYLNQPTKDPEEGASSKYLPNKCPNCNLVWGEDHGNELGVGFESLGAGVWKCNSCDEIIHELHDSNQGVTKF